MSFAENEWMITLVALDLGNSQLQSRHQISMVWNKQLEKTQLTQLTAKKDYPSFLRRKYFGTVLEGIADGLIQTDCKVKNSWRDFKSKLEIRNNSNYFTNYIYFLKL